MTQHETAQEAYCVKCKTKREVKNGHEETMEYGRRALKGGQHLDLRRREVQAPLPSTTQLGCC